MRDINVQAVTLCLLTAKVKSHTKKYVNNCIIYTTFVSTYFCILKHYFALEIGNFVPQVPLPNVTILAVKDVTGIYN
jgi:hypothetical protein